MNKIENLYKKIFTPNEQEIWKNRLTFSVGNFKKHKVSINNFFKNSKYLSKFEHISSFDEFTDIVCETSIEYANWSVSIDKNLIGKEFELTSFYKGAIGELFFYYLFNDNKNMVIYSMLHDAYVQYHFSYVFPTLKEHVDDGVDMYAVVNGVPCVIQCKFWNTESNISLNVIQKAHSSGIASNFISQNDKENVVICFTGNETNVNNLISSYKKYMDKIVIIGRNSINETLSTHKNEFFNEFYSFLNNLN